MWVTLLIDRTHYWLRVSAALLLFTLFASDAFARSPVPWSVGQSEGENLTIGLITFSRGDDIPSWFGHTALYVRDEYHQVERVYNYGMFSFGPDMLLNFLSGRLEFWVGEAPFSRTVRVYKSLDRDVRLQVLNLSPEKSVELAKFLDWNVQPENRNYLYDHYFDNCATRIRDVIDKSVDGQFHKANAVEGRFTLRDHVRRHTQRNAYIDVLLTVWMNSDIDVPLQQWEEMFLPTELELRVGELQYVNAQGETVPLVRETRILHKSERGPPPAEPSNILVYLFLFGAGLGGLVYLLGGRFDRQPTRGRRVAFAGLLILLGLLFGIPGLVIPLFHLTDHKITYWNANFLVTNPLTFMLIPLGFGLLFGKVKVLHWLAQCWQVLAVTSLLLLVAAPFIAQNVWIALALLLPFNLISAWSFRKFDPTRTPGEA